jgi:hypothetical protein
MADGAPRVRVTVERLPRRAIWLDSNVWINIGAARAGGRQTREDRDRAKNIFRVVAEKVRKQKLLCLNAGQHWEFYDQKPARDALELLTLGAELLPTSIVQRLQLATAMPAYLDRAKEMLFPLRTFFDEDPVRRVDRGLRSPFVLTVRMPQSEYLRHLRQEGKATTHRDVEGLRHRNLRTGVKFRQQLDLEAGGRRDALVKCIEDRIAAVAAVATARPAIAEQAARDRYLQALTYLSDWKGTTKRRPEEFWEFLKSVHARAIPYDDIQSRIYARLTTRDERVEPGDAADIDYLGLVLPIASYVVTDFAMMKVVRELGLDRKWGCDVYALRETDRLLATLTAL